MIRVFRYRLYPTRAQDERLRWTLERLRELYNAALEERREAYRRQREALSRYDQIGELSAVRVECPEYTTIHTHLLGDAITRLDRAFRAFFRRVKAGEKPGFPRFKGRSRYTSFTYADCSSAHAKKRWIVADSKRLDLTGIGKIKLKLHRPMEGRLKQVTITLDGDGHWYACMCCDEVPTKPLPATGESIGIDVGLSAFATLSTGEKVENPRHGEAAQAKLARAQRRLCRRKRGSNRRRKARLLLAKHYARIQRVRLDHHHKVALDLVRRFDRIAVEDLNVQGLAAGMLARQVNDAAWAQFIGILASKAECAGRELTRVDPRGTSQICSECGAEVRKDLGVRVHDCPHCGYVTDRDHNAARNVEQRAGHARRGGMSEGSPDEPRSSDLAVCGRQGSCHRVSRIVRKVAP